MCAVAHLQCSATLTLAKYISPLFSIAQQYRLTARNILALNTCVQWPTFSAVPH